MRFLFDRTLRKGFPKARTNRPFDPEEGPPTPADGRARLEGALARFAEACQAQAGTERLKTLTFGTVGLVDYVRFQEIHVRHHTKQMPAPSGETHGVR